MSAPRRIVHCILWYRTVNTSVLFARRLSKNPPFHFPLPCYAIPSLTSVPYLSTAPSVTLGSLICLDLTLVNLPCPHLTSPAKNMAISRRTKAEQNKEKQRKTTASAKPQPRLSCPAEESVSQSEPPASVLAAWTSRTIDSRHVFSASTIQCGIMIP